MAAIRDLLGHRRDELDRAAPARSKIGDDAAAGRSA
jgi:hypothetical protein